MDYRILTFLCVCRHMNYTKAAQELHITQPAVSQHIHALEQQYRTKLFKYEGRRLSRTEAGTLLYNASIQLRNDEETLKTKISSLSQEKKHIRLGTTRTIGEFMSTDLLSNYLNKHPHDNISICIANTTQLQQLIKENQLDFALVEGYFSKEDFDYLDFSHEPFVAVAHPEYQFKKTPHRLKDLTNERILIRERGSGTREILEKSLSVRSLSITDYPHFIEINSMHAILDLLMARLGISFLYERVVKAELKKGLLRAIPLDDFFVMHDFTCIWNRHSIFSQDYLTSFYDLYQ